MVTDIQAEAVIVLIWMLVINRLHQQIMFRMVLSVVEVVLGLLQVIVVVIVIVQVESIVVEVMYVQHAHQMSVILNQFVEMVLQGAVMQTVTVQL